MIDQNASDNTCEDCGNGLRLDDGMEWPEVPLCWGCLWNRYVEARRLKAAGVSPCHPACHFAGMERAAKLVESEEEFGSDMPPDLAMKLSKGIPRQIVLATRKSIAFRIREEMEKMSKEPDHAG